MSEQFVGPCVWVGREVLSCTKCLYLRCKLVKSGRHPDYDYFCLHPDAVSGKINEQNDIRLLAVVKKVRPAMEAHFREVIEENRRMSSIEGKFICNDCVTPETQDWCPIKTKRKELNEKSKGRACN